MKVILYLNRRVRQLILASIPISRVLELGLFDKLTKMKYDVPNDHIEILDGYIDEIENAISGIINK